jgi:hypothetical protein
MDNYKTIATKLANREPFTGNSMSASLDYGLYSVWSYNTLIADYKLGRLDEGEPRITFNDTKYVATPGAPYGEINGAPYGATHSATFGTTYGASNDATYDASERRIPWCDLWRRH